MSALLQDLEVNRKTAEETLVELNHQLSTCIDDLANDQDEFRIQLLDAHKQREAIRKDQDALILRSSSQIQAETDVAASNSLKDPLSTGEFLAPGPHSTELLSLKKEHQDLNDQIRKQEQSCSLGSIELTRLKNENEEMQTRITELEGRLKQEKDTFRFEKLMSGFVQGLFGLTWVRHDRQEGATKRGTALANGTNATVPSLWDRLLQKGELFRSSDREMNHPSPMVAHLMRAESASDVPVAVSFTNAFFCKDLMMKPGYQSAYIQTANQVWAIVAQKFGL